jgi:pimeloyl-ACP methyl ester carboxylesterase
MSAIRLNSLKATWMATQLSGRFSTRLSGRFADRLWFTPWPVPVSERGRAKQAEWLGGTEAVTFRSRHGPIAGFSAGYGPVILLVHGWGERAAFLGAFIQPLVDSGFRAIGIDLPGHGDTSRGTTNIFDLAHVLVDVADQLGDIEGVVAHSMGGTVTAVAVGDGLRPDAVAFLAPASNIDHVVEKFQTMFSLPTRAMVGLRRRIEHRFGQNVWDRLRIQELAADFDIPALIVHDHDDTQVDLADSEALVAAWPGARSIITSGLGHDRITRDPRIVDEVTAFLYESIDAHRDHSSALTSSGRVSR